MLPVLELVVSGVVAGPTLILDYRAQRFLNDIRSEHLVLNLSLPDPSGPSRKPDWKDRLLNLRMNGTKYVVALNMPGLILDLVPLAIRHKPTIGVSTTFLFDRWAWGAIFYPFYALPFWWILGRSFDCALALQASTPIRLRWWDLAAMLPAAILGLTAISALFTSTPADRADHEYMLLIDVVIGWGILCSSACVIWILQWKARRRLSRSAVA
jgi:hypothetical protein